MINHAAMRIHIIRVIISFGLLTVKTSGNFAAISIWRVY
jgi:hypothetical protein